MTTTTSLRKRTLQRTLKTILILYALICLVGGITLAELSLRLHKLPLGDTSNFYAHMQHLHATVEDASITASGGAILKGWYIVPPNPNGQSVIILHGVTANRVSSTGFAEMFLSRGYSVLVPDSREHGESGGTIATYGILERYDVKQWVQWMRQRARLHVSAGRIDGRGYRPAGDGHHTRTVRRCGGRSLRRLPRDWV